MIKGEFNVSNQDSNHAKIQLDVNKILSQLHLGNGKYSFTLFDVQNPPPSSSNVIASQTSESQKNKNMS